MFPSESVTVKTLLDDVPLSKDDKAYFEEFLNFYKPIKVNAYDEREILCEKVRRYSLGKHRSYEISTTFSFLLNMVSK